MFKYIANIFILFLLTILITSCFDGGNSLPGDGPSSPFNFQTSTSGFRIVNLSPNSPAVNFVMSSSNLIQNSKFRSASAAYEIGTTSRTIDMVDFFTKKGYKSYNITKEAGKALTFVIYDRFEYNKTALFDNVPRTMNKDKAALRFFLGTSDIASKVNIRVQNSVSSYSITEVEVGKVTDWIDVEAGNNNISIFPTLSNNVTLTAKAGLEGGKVYTAFIGGFANAPDSQKLGIYFLTDTDTRPQNLFTFKEGTSNYRFIQNSIGAAYDLLIDLNIKFLAMPFKRGSIIDFIRAGTRNIKLTMNNGVTVKFDGNFSFNFDRYYSIIAVGVPSKPEVLVLESTQQSPKSDQSMVRFVHCSANTPALRFSFIAGTTKSFAALSYKGASNYLTFPAGGIDVIVQNSATRDTISTGTLYVEGGKYYTAFVVPTAITGSSFTIEMIDDSNENTQDLFGQF